MLYLRLPRSRGADDGDDRRSISHFRDLMGRVKKRKRKSS